MQVRMFDASNARVRTGCSDQAGERCSSTSPHSQKEMQIFGEVTDPVLLLSVDAVYRGELFSQAIYLSDKPSRPSDLASGTSRIVIEMIRIFSFHYPSAFNIIKLLYLPRRFVLLLNQNMSV